MRSELGIFTSTPIPRFWKPISSGVFLARCNTVLSNHRWMRPVKEYSRSRYVCEDDVSAVITQFKFDNANLGDKIPRMGYLRKPFCPLCPVQHQSSGLHLLFDCGSLSALRVSSGIQSFINSCKFRGHTMESAYTLFVNGEDYTGTAVPLAVYLERGKCMSDMRKMWLSKW